MNSHEYSLPKNHIFNYNKPISNILEYEELRSEFFSYYESLLDTIKGDLNSNILHTVFMNKDKMGLIYKSI
ncbi:hypothetical protein D3C76_1628750 [compost metagenome]